MKKAPEAFRTISEVAEILETPAHVLRFWESKFYQIRPVKRAGGRRYYRPDDVALINGIRNLLQDQGMTIRGVQRVLQEQGAKHVATLGGGPLLAADPDGDYDSIDAIAIDEDDVSEMAAVDDLDAVIDQVETPLADEPDVDTVEFSPAPSTVSRLQEPEEEGPDAEDHEPLDQPPVESQASDTPPIAPLPVAAIGDTPDALPEGLVVAQESTTDSPAPRPFTAEKEPVARALPPAEKTPERDEADDEERLRASDRAQLARSLRVMPRGQLGKKRESYERVGRRIDALLERMSEASGAGRW